MKTRLQTEQLSLIQKGFPAEQVSHLKQRVEDAQQKWRFLKEDYSRVKQNVKDRSQYRLDIMKREIRIAKADFKRAWAQWVSYRRQLRQIPVMR